MFSSIGIIYKADTFPLVTPQSKILIYLSIYSVAWNPVSYLYVTLKLVTDELSSIKSVSLILNLSYITFLYMKGGRMIKKNCFNFKGTFFWRSSWIVAFFTVIILIYVSSGA